jgi:hypothetical protein
MASKTQKPDWLHTMLFIGIFIGVVAMLILTVISTQSKKTKTTKADYDQTQIINLIKCDTNQCGITLNRLKAKWRSLPTVVWACMVSSVGSERIAQIQYQVVTGGTISVTDTLLQKIEYCLDNAKEAEPHFRPSPTRTATTQ